MKNKIVLAIVIVLITITTAALIGCQAAPGAQTLTTQNLQKR